MKEKPDLSKYSDEELKAELSEREERAKEEKKPKPLPNPDFTGLINQCMHYVNHIIVYDYINPVSKENLVMQAIAAIYGEEVWMLVLEKLHKKG